MADTGVKYAQTVTEGSGGDQAWDSGTLDVAALNSVGSDYALLTGAAFDLNKLGNPVYCSNFAMGVPTDAAVTGIKVEISVTNSATAGGVCDNILQLSKVAGTGVGDNKASSTPYDTSGYVTRTYGGAGELWGTTWSVAEVNGTGFGVVYQPKSLDPNEDMGLDFIRITVYYSQDRNVNAPTDTIATTTTSETSGVRLDSLARSFVEPATVSDISTARLNFLRPTGIDPATASDIPTARLSFLRPSGIDSATISALATVVLATLTISATEVVTSSDSNTVTHDAVSMTGPGTVVCDSATAEIVEPEASDLSVTKEETITLSDGRTAKIDPLRISASESVSASDTIWVRIDPIQVVRTETTSVSDSSTSRLAALYALRSDSVTTSESGVGKVNPLQISKADSVTVSSTRSVGTTLTCLGYTSFAELDPGTYITISDNLIEFISLPCDVSSYVRYNCGTGFFGTAFTHRTSISIEGETGNAQVSCWALTQSPRSDSYAQITADDGVGLYYDAINSRINLRAYDNSDALDWYAVGDPTFTYYFTITRNGSSLIAEIYSDSERVTLVDTLSITCHATNTYTYIYGLLGNAYGTSNTITGNIGCLDIGKELPVNALRNEALTVSEVGTVRLAQLRTSRTDTASISDSSTVKLDTLCVSEADTLTVSEQTIISVTAEIPDLVPSGVDTTTISDVWSVRLATLRASQIDRITASETRTAKVSPLRVYGIERVTSRDIRTVQSAEIINLSVSKTERVTLWDQNNEIAPIPPTTITILKTERVTCSDVVHTPRPDRRVQRTAEVATVTDSRTVRITPLLIHRQESVTGSELGAPLTPPAYEVYRIDRVYLSGSIPVNLNVSRTEKVSLWDQNNELIFGGYVPYDVFRTEKVTISTGIPSTVVDRDIWPWEETTTVSESRTVKITRDLAVSKTEQVTASDLSSTRLPILNVSAQESVTVSDDKVVYPFYIPTIHQTEYVTSSEAASSRLGALVVSRVDAVTTSETRAVRVNPLVIYKSETVSLSETRSVLTIPWAVRTERVTVSEQARLRLDALIVSKQDSVTLSESKNVKLPSLAHYRKSTTTISESATVSVERLAIWAREIVTASEVSTKREFSPVWLRATEKVTISDASTPQVDFLQVSATETVTVSEAGLVASGIPVLGWNPITIQGIDLITGNYVIIQGVFKT